MLWQVKVIQESLHWTENPPFACRDITMGVLFLLVLNSFLTIWTSRKTESLYSNCTSERCRTLWAEVGDFVVISPYLKKAWKDSWKRAFKRQRCRNVDTVCSRAFKFFCSISGVIESWESLDGFNDWQPFRIFFVTNACVASWMFSILWI